MTILNIVETELGNPYALLVGGAIEFMAQENQQQYSDDQIIHFAWKAKRLIDTHRSSLNKHPGFRQQHIVKCFLAGHAIQEWL